MPPRASRVLTRRIRNLTAPRFASSWTPRGRACEIARVPIDSFLHRRRNFRELSWDFIQFI
jgi:hypothetical protein